jgi:hypothetical protein
MTDPNSNSRSTYQPVTQYHPATHAVVASKSRTTYQQVTQWDCVSCRCSLTLTQTYQSDFAVRLADREAPVAWLPPRDESPLVRVSKDKIKTSRVQPC